MSTVTFKGAPVNLSGSLPAAGSKAPDFVLTKTDLSDVSLKDFTGSVLILSIFPSVDTSVCAASVRKFNTEADKLGGCKILCVSMDLSFAHGRFCAAEGIKSVVTASELRGRTFGDGYGVRIAGGPLAGLFARAAVVVDGKGTVVYTQLAPEITGELDYAKIIEAAKKALAGN